MMGLDREIAVFVRSLVEQARERAAGDGIGEAQIVAGIAIRRPADGTRVLLLASGEEIEMAASTNTVHRLALAHLERGIRRMHGELAKQRGTVEAA